MRRLLALTALSAALAAAAPAQAQCMAMYACDAVELAQHVVDELRP